MPITYYQEDEWTASYNLEPDKRFWGIPVYRVDNCMKADSFLSQCLKSWRLVEVEYLPEYASSYFVKRGIQARMLRFRLVLVKIYWKFIQLCWGLGFVDTGVGELFSWRDFYRIKTH